MKYRKKPIVIEAIQLTPELFWDCYENKKAVFDKFTFCGYYHPPNKTIYDAYITIETLEGNMRAILYDWIIKGIAGEFYPCKPDIFEKTYEPASTPPPPQVDEEKIRLVMATNCEMYPADEYKMAKALSTAFKEGKLNG